MRFTAVVACLVLVAASPTFAEQMMDQMEKQMGRMNKQEARTGDLRRRTSGYSNSICGNRIFFNGIYFEIELLQVFRLEASR